MKATDVELRRSLLQLSHSQRMTSNRFFFFLLLLWNRIGVGSSEMINAYQHCFFRVFQYERENFFFLSYAKIKANIRSHDYAMLSSREPWSSEVCDDITGCIMGNFFLSTYSLCFASCVYWCVGWHLWLELFLWGRSRPKHWKVWILDEGGSSESH